MMTTYEIMERCAGCYDNDRPTGRDFVCSRCGDSSRECVRCVDLGALAEMCAVCGLELEVRDVVTTTTAENTVTTTDRVVAPTSNLEPLKPIAIRLRVAKNALNAFVHEFGIATAGAFDGGTPLYESALVENAVEANRPWFIERAARHQSEQDQHRFRAEDRRAKAEQQRVATEAAWAQAAVAKVQAVAAGAQAKKAKKAKKERNATAAPNATPAAPKQQAHTNPAPPPAPARKTHVPEIIVLRRRGT